MKQNHTLPLDEGQRQLTLMALAHLAVERPGFDYALSEIAKAIDNETPAGPELYTTFKTMHAEKRGIVPAGIAERTPPGMYWVWHAATWKLAKWDGEDIETLEFGTTAPMHSVVIGPPIGLAPENPPAEIKTT